MGHHSLGSLEFSVKKFTRNQVPKNQNCVMTNERFENMEKLMKILAGEIMFQHHYITNNLMSRGCLIVIMR